MVRLVSTRGGPAVDFTTAILSGLAPDGGLYVPEAWPTLSRPDSPTGFNEVAEAVIGRFSSELSSGGELSQLVGDSFARFEHPEIAPLVELAPNLYLMELFWGPTLAFKDFALQVLGRLVDVALGRRGGRAMILGATSGDTGSAAMEAFRDREWVDVVILFPAGRTTEVQRLQMTTIDSPNVHAIAVEGTFDDCQDLVKGVFADAELRNRLSLTTANSINFGRLITQIAYYVWAVERLGKPVTFAVPSGNFGNVYSGYAAACMGAPIRKLIVGSNANNVLDGFFRNGRLDLGEVIPTLSPSMDIQIPSNLERLMFDLYRRDGRELTEAMGQLREKGRLEVGEGIYPLFISRWCDDQATIRTMREVHSNYGIVVDPHSAVGIAAARETKTEGPVVCLATAHPAKFPEAVRQAIGHLPAQPPSIEDLYHRPERVTDIPGDLQVLRRLLKEKSRFW
ncbi:MAG: threonine synthase [Acidimicrobiia bacterium]|nr:threonine synthase [Acidimicrobiia bacterium]